MRRPFIRILSLLLLVSMLMGLVACGQTPDTTASTAPTQPSSSTQPKPDGTNRLTIYWSFSGDASTAGFWIWPKDGDGAGYTVTTCDFGVVCIVDIPVSVTEVGFIACYDCTNLSGSGWIGGTKDWGEDRFVTMNGDVTIYLKQGDGMIYYTEEDANAAANVINFAEMTSFTTIKYNLPKATRVESLEDIRVYKDGVAVEVLSSSTLGNKVNHGVITLAEPLDLGGNYTLEIAGFDAKQVVPTKIFDTEEFINNYTYDGTDLGSVINADGSTTFKVWAPTASKVVLNLFSAGNGVNAYDNLEMTKADRGVWELTVPSTGHGIYYTYSVTTAQGTQEAVDPYAKACGVNGQRGMVVDLDSTDPADWFNDEVVTLEKYSDATIWEVHVRDFSNNIASSQYKGKFLAFTERGLTNSSGVSVGVDYLTNLGVSHLHLLPIYDYQSVDETNPTFNWGYDPQNYNCLEGSYSTDPYNGEIRMIEFKQMVQSLHASGLGVIMDVVYNHTYVANSNLNKVVPYYYYRYTSTGANTSASGCGNDTASERYMFRKYMVDSVSYLASEYHLDGFRFDLMGLHDVETMQAIEQAVHAINPNAIIYGEAWDMAGSTTSATMMTQANAHKVTATEGAAGGVAVFSDTVRDGLKGSVWDAIPHGYINGNFKGSTNAIKFSIAGSSFSGFGWQVNNANVINYMSCHDNMTLWDILEASCDGLTVAQLAARNRLGIGILMVSQGVPFWQAGEEMLRTKDGDHNSYQSSDAINNINWEALTLDSQEYATMLYYQGLIQMRNAYSIFRSDGSDVTVAFANLPGGGLAVTYQNANGVEAIVLINPSDASASYTLDGQWNLVATGTQAGSDVLATESGNVTVEAYSIRVYVKG